MPSDKAYSNYGGRGIAVDADWYWFENFLRDMGDKPSSDHTLERIDNSKGYSKFNCRWATRSEQCLNRRRFKNNSTGEIGVKRAGRRFLAVYQSQGVRHQIGRFDTVEEATKARSEFIALFKIDPERAVKLISEPTVWNTSSTGLRGITSHVDGGFMARATIDGKRHYVGYFKTLGEAIDARLAFIRERTGRSES